MNEWQPIETAPKDGTPVLLFTPDRHYVAADTRVITTKATQVVAQSYGGDWYLAESGAHCTDDRTGEHATHWTPLPAPPASQNEG